MAIMMATDRAASRDSDQWTDCSSGAMAQQSSPGYEAAPPTFVRLTGSHLVKPRAPRQD